MDDTEPTGLRLSQPPEFHNRDIDAMRNFLPDKLLGRTAALLSLVVPVQGFAGAVDQLLNWGHGVDLGSMPLRRGALLIGLPALAVAAQAVLEWDAERQRRRMRDLAAQPHQMQECHFRRGIPSRGFACTALVLLTLTGTGGHSAKAGQQLSELDQIRTELAESGLDVTIEPDSSSIKANLRFSPARFAASAGLLARLSAVTPTRSFDLSDNTQVADLEPLRGLTALTTLNLYRTRVANLKPLKGLTALTTLNLYGTQVADLEPLKGLTALTTLNLYGTQVVNLEPLKGLTTLVTLILSGTQVADLGPLQDLPNVRLGMSFFTLPRSVTRQERDRFDAYRASKGLPTAY